MRARTAVLCSVADQGVAALTNILVLLAAARLSTLTDFARFSAVYLVFTVLLGVSGAYTGQPLVLKRGAGEETRGACRSAVAFTVLASAALGALLAAVCLLVPAIPPAHWPRSASCFPWSWGRTPDGMPSPPSSSPISP